MSLEVFGDEGDVPSCWEDTAMRQDFDAVIDRYRKWLSTYKNEFDSPELEEALGRLSRMFDASADLMKGPFFDPA